MSSKLRARFILLGLLAIPLVGLGLAWVSTSSACCTGAIEGGPGTGDDDRDFTQDMRVAPAITGMAVFDGYTVYFTGTCKEQIPVNAVVPTTLPGATAAERLANFSPDVLEGWVLKNAGPAGCYSPQTAGYQDLVIDSASNMRVFEASDHTPVLKAVDVRILFSIPNLNPNVVQ